MVFIERLPEGEAAYFAIGVKIGEAIDGALVEIIRR